MVLGRKLPVKQPTNTEQILQIEAQLCQARLELNHHSNVFSSRGIERNVKFIVNELRVGNSEYTRQRQRSKAWQIQAFDIRIIRPRAVRISEHAAMRLTGLQLPPPLVAPTAEPWKVSLPMTLIFDAVYPPADLFNVNHVLDLTQFCGH